MSVIRRVEIVMLVALALLAGTAAPPASAAEPDVTGPQLVAATSPVSTGTAEAPRFAFTVRATDDSSGVRSVSAHFVQVGTTQKIYASGSETRAGVLDSTVDVRGSYSRYQQNGTWRLDTLYVEDRSNNLRTYDEEALAALGVVVDLVVSGVEDTTPPTLTSNSMQPPTVELTSGSTRVIQRVGLRDDLSGVDYVDAFWSSPSGVERRGYTEIYPGGLREDNALIYLDFGPGDEAGVWTLERLEMVDNVGNLNDETRADWEAAGITTTLLATRTVDDVAPELFDVVTRPQTIDATAGEVPVEISVRAEDAFSGLDVEATSATLRGPDGTLLTASFSRREGVEIYSFAVLRAVFPAGERSRHLDTGPRVSRGPSGEHHVRGA